MTTTYLRDRATAGSPPPAEVITITFGGRTFRAGRRTDAHLAWTQEQLDQRHPGCRLVVLQSCYHTGYAPSAGTHDGDGVLDFEIEGDMGAADTAGHWRAAEGFLRSCGWVAWWRHTGSWASPSSWHVHAVSDGCPGPVGEYVPGQVDDYHAIPPRDGLAGHAPDPTWHPADIGARRFDYPAYLAALAEKETPVPSKPAPAARPRWRKVRARRGLAPSALTVITRNLKAGRPAGDVVSEMRLIIAAQDPDVVVLQEAVGYWRALRKQLGGADGYRVIVARGWSESSDVAIMVRRGLPVSRWGSLRLLTAWVGPLAGKRHTGRTFLAVDLANAWRIVGIHMTTGGPTGGTITKGRNRPAWLEQMRALQALNDRRGSRRRSLVELGDWNAEPTDRHPDAPAALAKAGGLVVATDGGGVDYALLRDCAATKVTTGPRFGSDHPFRTYHLTRETR